MVPAEIRDAAGIQSLVKVMRQRGFGERLIQKICWKNWLRVLGRTWSKSKARVTAAG